MNNMKEFWDMVITQRAWSWSLIGIAYLFVYLLVRHFFLCRLIKGTKALHSKWYNEVKRFYARQCIGGWILFMASFLLLIFFWETANLKQASLYEAAMCVLIILTVLLSIISHLVGFGIALLHLLKHLEKNELTL
jgi:hypothetical protein